MATSKNITYINKDFNELKANLINYARTYFPTTYNDFSPSSPGMMFIEMASYVGDILSFYIDNQVQENYLQFAKQSNNLYQLAYMFGYKPNVTGVATVTIDFYQQVPAKTLGGEQVPDYDYALYIPQNSIVSTNLVSPISFLVQDDIDFCVSSSSDPTEVSVYQITGNSPTLFLLKKSRKAISSTINTTTFSFGSPTEFATVEINADRIIGILDITDSNGNVWYEVDYLAQENVYDSIRNTNPNDPNNSNNSGDVPYILKLKKVQRRFVTRVLNETTLQLQFGAGNINDNDEEITPNSDNIGLGLVFERNKLNTAYDPTNFMFTKTYGIAPSNTTLTVRYLTGGGVTANVFANSISNFSGNPVFKVANLVTSTANNIFASLEINNPEAADGGNDGDTIEDIRQNAIANFSTQLRNITANDYLVRALSMPSKYGNIAKAFIKPTKLQNIGLGEMPTTLDLCILTYNINKNLTTTTTTLKQNLTTYLSQHRIIGDSIRVKDAFIINIEVNFDIIVLPNYNSNEILSKCITALQNYFAIDKWQINQPIILRDIYILLDRIEGVQTVKNITITNKVGTSLGYSQYAYDILSATTSNIIYPSLDPMIFEVKYPNTDIQGRVVSL
jgi:hypothetical protein